MYGIHKGQWHLSVYWHQHLNMNALLYKNKNMQNKYIISYSISNETQHGAQLFHLTFTKDHTGTFVTYYSTYTRQSGSLCMICNH